MGADAEGLGRLESLPVRAVWPSESADFTPWLLRNAQVLGAALGMDLQLTEAEHAVGGFSLDLIGSDALTGETVIVENQLEPSDHLHLGQVLTYAAGTDPVNVVWLCTRFREEHRAALDWLNERTDDRTRFFGVEVSLVRIGESAPAPLLRVAAAPNDWGKLTRASTSRSTRTTEAQFVAAVREQCDPTTRDGLLGLLESTRGVPGFSGFYWGEGSYPSVTAVMESEVGRTQPWSVYIERVRGPVLALNFDWLHKRGGAFDDNAVATFVSGVTDLPGVADLSKGAREGGWKRRPSIPAAPLFADPRALPTLVGALQRLYGAGAADSGSR